MGTRRGHDLTRPRPAAHLAPLGPPWSHMAPHGARGSLEREQELLEARDRLRDEFGGRGVRDANGVGGAERVA